MIKKVILKNESEIKKIKLFNLAEKEYSRDINNTFLTLNLQRNSILKGDFLIIKTIEKFSEFKSNFFNKDFFEKKTYFKFSYEFFKKIQKLLKICRNRFNSTFILTKVNLKGFFEVNLNLNSIQKFITKNIINFKHYALKKRFFKKIIRNFLRSSKRFTFKNISEINLIKAVINKKLALNKKIMLLLNKILFKNHQRIFSILNYGFFFTFLLKSNNITELSNLFITEVIFKKNIFFFKFYNTYLFKNYFFRNDFWGINNRYYFIYNDISSNFSEVYNNILANSSRYYNFKTLNKFYTKFIN